MFGDKDDDGETFVVEDEQHFVAISVLFQYFEAGREPGLTVMRVI